jgi:hypothetical protein
MSLDQSAWKIIEYSAKPHGTELGIKAKEGSNEFLGFLYRAPKGEKNAAGCRDGMLRSERVDAADISDRDLMQSRSGVEIATVFIALHQQTRLEDHTAGTVVSREVSQADFRAFIGSGEICGDISFFYDPRSADAEVSIKSFREDLKNLRFDPNSKPSFLGAFTYATAEMTHVASGEVFKTPPEAAFEDYQLALDRVNTSDNPDKWRAITTDERAIAFSFMQGIAGLRSTLTSLVARQPDNYDPYYLLANVDALDKNSMAARLHLQQAFDRRANVLPGDIFPDPAKNPAFMELKDDKQFWVFVEDLSRQVRQSE